MLSLLKIKHVALIDEIEIEFGRGLNLLTGETGSGKSIIVDSLGALTRERVSNHLIKHGRGSAVIEGLFSMTIGEDLRTLFYEKGIDNPTSGDSDLIRHRHLSLPLT